MNSGRPQIIIYILYILLIPIIVSAETGLPQFQDLLPLMSGSTNTIQPYNTSEPAGETVSWDQKFILFSYKNKNIGYVNIQSSKIVLPFRPPLYKCFIQTKSDLPIWFFSGKSVTEETEYYDEKINPLLFEFKLDSDDMNLVVQGKLSTGISVSTSPGTYEISWETAKTRKNASLDVPKNICTAGNLRDIILSRDITKKQTYHLSLLDKYKMKYMTIRVNTGETVQIADETFYRVKLTMKIFGRFEFIVDKNGNVISGKGLGIKLIPM